MINPKKELFKWGPIDGRPIYVDAFVQAFVPYPKKTGISFPDIFGFLKDDKCVFISDHTDLRNHGESVFKKYALDANKLRDGFNSWMEIVQKLKKVEETVNRGMSELSDEELMNLFISWDELHIGFWLTGFLPEFSNWGGEQLLKRKILGFNKMDFIDIFEALSAPEDLSFFQKEELELVQIKLTKDKESRLRKLREHQKKYYWLRNSYGFTKVLDIEFFRHELAEVSGEDAEKKISEINNYVKQVMDKKKETIKKYNIEDEIVNIAQKLAYCIWWQDFRKQYIFIANHIVTKFMEEINIRKGIKFKELCYYCTGEIIELLKNNKTVDTVQRFDGFLMYYHENKDVSYMTGKEANDYASPYIEIKIDKGIKELSGVVVSKGKETITRGRVKILFTPRNLQKMKAGDILVAPMTSPDYIVAMRKASAIVTDEGGITSHAAIVARELKKPCIVGTRIATKWLKDNDLIEVDTEKGTVRKMKTEAIKKMAVKQLKRPIIFERMPGVLHTVFVPAISIMDDLAKLDLHWDFFYFIFKEDFMGIIYPEDRQVMLGERLLKEELKNPGAYQKIIDGWKLINHDYDLMCKNLDTIDLTGMDLREIKNIYVKFFNLFKKVWALPLTVTAISYYSDNVWIPRIVKKYGKQGLGDFILLSTPADSSYLKKEEHNFLRIAAEISKSRINSLTDLRNQLPLLEELKKHAREFFWIHNTYRDGAKLDAEYFFEHMKAIKNPEERLSQFGKEHQDFIKRHAAIINNNRFNTGEKAIARLIRKGTTFQDKRKRNNLIGNYYMLAFIRAISKKTKYSYKELCYATPYEVINILSGDTISKEKLLSRTKCCVFYITPEENIVFGGGDASRLYSLLDNPHTAEKDIKELKGIIASLGKARGRVRVVQDANKAKEFYKGDILVASMTRPEYIRLMKKAAAIITDEGGITCHAAIISRELKIPCIIGTKIATKVFKDGDLVEVDADNGIVRKLN